MGTQRKIGLAISGGGSRAIAFHLGCLRALNRLGLLEDVSIVSTVSGGSVIGAYKHLHRGDFAQFEDDVRRLLARGLARPMLKRMFSLAGIRVLVAFLVTAALALPLAIARVLASLAANLLPPSISSRFEGVELRSPLHRFASRTTLLEITLDELLFKGATLTTVPQEPQLVVNATELRTGSAFRFSTLESGSWRWGKLHNNNVRLAHAVAASAAYPLFLPAFDESYVFEHQGQLETSRVILSDGGVYDNLGLGCLWPGRSAIVSLNVNSVDTIIACSAGYGLRQDPPSQFIVARMLSAFNTTFERAQNAAINRLHEIKQFGRVKNFIFPYLGQLDKELPNAPANLVRREEAHAYPTNFNAMSEEWIDRLSLRGEQLTECLARAYLGPLLAELAAVKLTPNNPN